MIFLVMFLSLAYFIVNIQCIICVTDRICVSQLFRFSIRLQMNSSSGFGESEVPHKFLTEQRLSAPHPHVVQDVNVYSFF